MPNLLREWSGGLFFLALVLVFALSRWLEGRCS